MFSYPLKTATILSTTILSLTIATESQAITFNFNWMGQVAGFKVTGSFSYDETQNYTNGIVTEQDLDSLEVSFFGPDGSFLRTYSDNHLDPGVNFNFDTNTREILQAGSWPDPDGINIGDGSRTDGLTFWSKPPTSGTPHVHVDDWLNEFGYPPAFRGSPASGEGHEDVAFPGFMTSELTVPRFNPGILDAYTSPNGEPATGPDEFGQFAQATLVPEPGTLLGLLSFGGWFLTSKLKLGTR